MHDATAPPLIAIVDDDPGLLRLMERRLQKSGWRTVGFPDGAQAILHFVSSPPDLAVIDYKLPDMAAGELVRELARRKVAVPFIVATGFGDERVAVEMMKRGALDYLMKDGAFLDLLPQVVAQAMAGIERDRRLGRTREALRLLESAVRQAKDAIVITTADIDSPGPRIVFVNPAFCELTGFSEDEILARTPRILQGPETDRAVIARLRTQLERGEPFFGYLRNYRKDGTSYLVEIRMGPIRDDNGAITHWVAIQRDITERNQLEEQLRQASKLEAIGSLAGGIAHDFNNMLAVIRIQSDVLLESIGSESPLRPDIESIRKACEHSADLTRQLLAFSRKQVLQPRVLDLPGVLGRAESLLRHLIGESIEIETKYDPATPRVKADPGQIEQVVVNLAVNARDAMPAGGRLAVTLRDFSCADGAPPPVAEMPAGRYAQLRIEDSGVGMSQETLAHIFEPFFTTKAPGLGTGLGLATVYGVVRQSGGHIKVESTPGAGTAFTVYLPATNDAPETSGSAPESPAFTIRGVGVLLVEDQPMVRTLLARCLESAGYRVIEASHGDEALALFREHRDTLEIVVTDIVMPKMSGTRLVELLRGERPDLSIVYMSGYADESIEASFVADRSARFLAKPFTPSELADVLARIVAERRRPSSESGLLG